MESHKIRHLYHKSNKKMDLLIGYTNFDKVVNDLRSFFYDARHFQILYLGSFLLMGIFFLQWNTDYLRYGIIIGVALLVQMVAAFFTTKNYQSYKSALITALGLCLLCKTNLYMTGFIAAAIAIASKFLIRYKNKHIFNPVNFGIVVTIFLTGDAWVSPGQWGSHFVWIFMLGALGFLVLKKVNRIDTSLTFLLVFGGLQFIRTVFYLGWSVDVFIHQVSSGTLMLFTFFMITDPMTTPNHRNGRIVWATCIAVASFLLSNYMYVYAAPIWVLFFASPLVPLFDKLFVAKKYEWNFLNK